MEPHASAPDPSAVVAAAVVNYATPAMTRRALWSLRSLYPALPLYVVDAGSPDDSADRLRAWAAELEPCTLIACDHNVHHGPGLDLALRRMDTPWGLVFDSDCLAYRRGFLEAMLAEAEDAYKAEDAYMIGQRLLVGPDGFPPTDADASPIPYVHPKCALVHRATYNTLPPFDKHGAPCLTNARAAAERGLPLVHFPVDDYVFHLGRGTVERHGYGLGFRGPWQRLRHLARRLRPGA